MPACGDMLLPSIDAMSNAHYAGRGLTAERAEQAKALNLSTQQQQIVPGMAKA
jgi:hypothetical protein